MTTLSEYASGERLTKCMTCQLPLEVYGEVTQGRNNGISYAIISRWLEDEHGIHIGKDALRQHFASRHKPGN